MIKITDETLTELLKLAESWRYAAEQLEFVGEEYDSAEDEVRDAMSKVYSEAASKLMFQIAPYSGLLDTESSASRQHFIETGEYLPVDVFTLRDGSNEEYGWWIYIPASDLWMGFGIDEDGTLSGHNPAKWLNEDARTYGVFNGFDEGAAELIEKFGIQA